VTQLIYGLPYINSADNLHQEKPVVPLSTHENVQGLIHEEIDTLKIS
jgi:hypothetical protein